MGDQPPLRDGLQPARGRGRPALRPDRDADDAQRGRRGSAGRDRRTPSGCSMRSAASSTAGLAGPTSSPGSTSPTESTATLAIDATRAGTRRPRGLAGSVGVRHGPWAPLPGPELLSVRLAMAGSADGASSTRSASGASRTTSGTTGSRRPGSGSFDAAASARSVAHWAPAGPVRPDRVRAGPGAARHARRSPVRMATGSPADWSTSLRFHDPRTGEVVEVLGDVGESSGFVPSDHHPERTARDRRLLTRAVRPAILRSRRTDPWCSGPTCQPVTLEIAGSNPVGSAIRSPLPDAPFARPNGASPRPGYPAAVGSRSVRRTV